MNSKGEFDTMQSGGVSQGRPAGVRCPRQGSRLHRGNRTSGNQHSVSNPHLPSFTIFLALQASSERPGS